MKVKQNTTIYYRDKGFTLVELLIAMVISGIVGTAIYTAYQSQVRMSAAQEQITEMQQSIRSTLHMMVNEIRMAGYDPDSLATAGITNANANAITFTLVADDDGIDNDNADGDDDPATGFDEAGELKTITYDLYNPDGDADNDLRRQDGAAAPMHAENIENIEFTYLDSTGNTTAVLNDIRRIHISILARSAYPARKFTNTTTYTSASGTIWGSFNDQYRRRLLTTRVICRNMGM